MTENPIQWNLSNTDTIGTKVFVLISEVSSFQGKIKDIYIKLGLSQVSRLSKLSLFQRCPSFKKRGSTVLAQLLPACAPRKNI